DDGTGPVFQRGDTVIVQLLVTVDKRYKGAGVQQELSGHGATDESGTRDAVGLGQTARWQHCREGRARARSVALPVRSRGNAPKLPARLPSACAVAVSLIAPTWLPNQHVIAWSIGVPFGSSIAMHCSTKCCKIQVFEGQQIGVNISPNVLAPPDRD